MIYEPVCLKLRIIRYTMRLSMNTYTFVTEGQRQMNIGIFEMEHFEGAYPVIRLFDSPENLLVIYTNEQTYIRFRDLLGDSASKFSWVIRPDNETVRGFLSRMYDDSRRRRLHLLYFNTISNNHLLYALLINRLRQTRVVVTIHSINCLFSSSPGSSFKSMVRHIGKRWLAREIKEFNVVSGTMIQYLSAKAGRGKKIHNVPGAVFENRKKENVITNAVRLVVPGSIDGKRRDYDQVFELLALSEKNALQVELVMLGGRYGEYGKAIIERAKIFAGKYTHLYFYETDTVDQQIFDLQMDAAHFVYIPSVVETVVCGNIPEVYGITKSSGNIFDVIKHAKPFIIPRRLSIPEDMENSCIRYDQPEAIVIFLRQVIRQPEEYADWQRRAYRTSEAYSIEKIRYKNPSLF